MRRILTPGQCSDCGQAEALLEGFNPKAVIADKGYDSQEIVDRVRAMKAKAVIPT